MNKHITAFDLDLIVISALRWNISSCSGNPENTRQFLLANWYHPHIVRKHWLYLEDLERDTSFCARVDGINRDEWYMFRAELASLTELPRHRLNRCVRDTGAGLLTVDALHYAMGRQSYMPGVVMDFIRSNWQHPELQQQRDTILSTIRQWLDRQNDSSEWVYLPQWQKLFKELNK